MTRSFSPAEATTRGRPGPQDTVSSLRRAFLLLDCFTAEVGELSIRELAARAGVPRSTTHRLVAELVDWGALERGARGLRLGVKLFELGSLAPTTALLRTVAAPALNTLAVVTGLTANLGAPGPNGVVYLDRVGEPSDAVTRPSVRAALHATGLGKAILAHSPHDEVETLLGRPLARFTARTLTAPELVARELVAVRLAGAAFDHEESQPGVCCVAAPVRDRNGVAIAAVSVSSTARFSYGDRCANAVIGTARTIERRLRQRQAG